MTHPQPTPEMLDALSRVPSGSFLITSGYAEVRDGRIIDRVQVCGTSPATLLVAMEKGHTLSPLIRDSRTFGIALLDPNERLLQRVFGPDRRIGDDPFLTYPHRIGTLGAPIVTRGTAWFDCEVVRHLDMETNYELFVGLVHDAGLGNAPASRLNAALSAARNGDARAARPRMGVDRASAAESPADRPRSTPRAPRSADRLG